MSPFQKIRENNLIKEYNYPKQPSTNRLSYEIAKKAGLGNYQSTYYSDDYIEAVLKYHEECKASNKKIQDDYVASCKAKDALFVTHTVNAAATAGFDPESVEKHLNNLITKGFSINKDGVCSSDLNHEKVLDDLELALPQLSAIVKVLKSQIVNDLIVLKNMPYKTDNDFNNIMKKYE